MKLKLTTIMLFLVLLSGCQVSVSTEGKGDIVFSPKGAECQSEDEYCFDYPPQTQVTLTAEAKMGYEFSHWSEVACGTDLTCVLSVSGDMKLKAIFNKSSGVAEAIDVNGGKVALPGVALVDFPANSFKSETVVNVFAGTSKEFQELFDEFTAMFRPHSRMSYEVVIDTGHIPPASEYVDVKINIPIEMLNNIPEGYGIQVFAMVEHGSSDEEAYPIVELFPSTFNITSGVVELSLPAATFSNNEITEYQYQAILTLAFTPGKNSSEASSIKASRVLMNAQEEEACEASTIICPVLKGCEVSSAFQKARTHPVLGGVRPHYGTDFFANHGDSIVAAAGGTIEMSYSSISYGETIVLRHNDGGATLYAHLDTRIASVGNTVQAGDLIGLADSTGSSTGHHLHFEYVPNGEIIRSQSRINPELCINASLSGSVTVSDSGNLADDAFEISIVSALKSTSSIYPKLLLA